MNHHHHQVQCCPCSTSGGGSNGCSASCSYTRQTSLSGGAPPSTTMAGSRRAASPGDEARFFARSRSSLPTAAANTNNDSAHSDGGCCHPPNMKRQRVSSPQTQDNATSNNLDEDDEEDENHRQRRERTHVMPMFLCIPMLLLAFIQCTSTVVTASSNNNVVGGGIPGGGKVYHPKNRPVPPSRPAHAIDVDYGGEHPFDEHRHLWDPVFAARKKNGLLRPNLQMDQLLDGRRAGRLDEINRIIDISSQGTRLLKKDKDEDKDKETDRPTNEPTKEPTEAPMASLNKGNGFSSGSGNGFSSSNGSGNNQDKPNNNPSEAAFDQADASPLVFEGVDTSTFQVSAATTNGNDSDDDEDTTTNDQQQKMAPSAATTTLDPKNDHKYRPLRIQFDTRQLAQQMDIALSAGDAIAATKLYLLIYEILPMTARTWGDVLRVVPVTGGIYPLAAQGSGVDQLLPNGQSNEGDATLGDDARGYHEDPVRLMYCPDETTSGIEGGADLLVYATVNRHCAKDGSASTNNNGQNDGQQADGMGTLASALSCQRDQYDRPITGSIDFCLEGMRGTVQMNVAQSINQKMAGGFEKDNNMVGGEGATYTWDGWNGVTSGDGSTTVPRNDGSGTDGQQGNVESNRKLIQYSVGVAVHEIGHVLGVTSDSLAYFRHPITGHPLTRRPFEVSTVTCVDGTSTAYVGMPGPHVMQEGRHEATGNRYFEVVTPTVQRVVRNHFNCPTMKGARLENQPTSTDCFGSHWDEHLYYTEIMGAVFSQGTNILSPLTLAYLEDSGWYRANYNSPYVHISTFGHGAGCNFIEGSCIDKRGRVPDIFQEQFCNTPISIKSNGLIDPDASGSQTCDPSHTQKTYCDLVNTNELVAIGKQGTTLEPAPPKFQYFEGNPNLRPYTFTTADYCPIPHLDPQSCLEHNGRSIITTEQKAAGEVYGPDSRCIETDGSRSYSLCLQTRCNTRLGMVQIMAGGKRRTCAYDGQVHEIMYNYDGSSDEVLRIKCPKAALVCPQLFCPANCAGRGECRYKSDVGDDDDEYDTTTLAQCVCDSEDDASPGCTGTNLTFPAVYGYAYENPHRANKTLFMVIVGSLVAGLALMFVVVRQWKARRNVFM